MDAFRAKHLLTFHDRLGLEMWFSGAIDKYNNVLKFKSELTVKGEITHIRTAYYLKKEFPINLPPGTIMKSVHGILFHVKNCKERDEYQYQVKR